MKKKGLLAFILIVAITGGAFAQGEGFSSLPKNTIVLDVVPLYIGAIIGMTVAAEYTPEQPINVAGFGIGMQYERQLTPEISAGLRFHYLWMGDSFNNPYDDIHLNSSTLAIEGLFRFYFRKTFFLGVVLGYGNMFYDGHYADLSENIPITTTTNYLKLGPRMGWRIDFRSPGGFIFDITLGYDLVMRLGESTEEQIRTQVGRNINLDTYTLSELFLFAGGPRLGLSVGWRF